MKIETVLYELMQLAREKNFSIVFTTPKSDHDEFVKMVNEWAIPSLDVKKFLKARNVKRVESRAFSSGMFETQASTWSNLGHWLYLIKEREFVGDPNKTYPIIIDHEKPYHRMLFLSSFGIFVYKDPRGVWKAFVERWREGPTSTCPSILLATLKGFDFSEKPKSVEERHAFISDQHARFLEIWDSQNGIRT